MHLSFSRIRDKIRDTLVINLPSYLDNRILYGHLKDDLTQLCEQVISYSQFCRILNLDFPDVLIPKVSQSQTQPLLISKRDDNIVNAPGGDSPVKQSVIMIALSLRGVNHGFCTHLRCQGPKSTIFKSSSGLHSKKQNAVQYSMTKFIPSLNHFS